MSNDQVSITELSFDELRSWLEEADIVQLDSEDHEFLSFHSIDDEGITIAFDNSKGEEFSFIFNEDARITKNGNKITIEDPQKPEETCEFLMFKKVPLID